LQSLQRSCLLLPPASACVTEYLIAVRAAIILWISLAVMPTEIVFDAIEAELERRDVER
jgi:hypothetical protein